ncbi:MAG: hypothetical protein ACRBBR_06615 [Cellvibrionaceae bacterium]
MSDDNKTNTAVSRKPDLGAYDVNNAPNGKSHWNQVGAAWLHKDGKGFNLKLDSIPVNGKVVLREMRDERMQAYEQEQHAKNNQQQQNQAAPTMSKGYGYSR